MQIASVPLSHERRRERKTKQKEVTVGINNLVLIVKYATLELFVSLL